MSEPIIPTPPEDVAPTTPAAPAALAALAVATPASVTETAAVEEASPVEATAVAGEASPVEATPAGAEDAVPVSSVPMAAAADTAAQSLVPERAEILLAVSVQVPMEVPVDAAALTQSGTEPTAPGAGPSRPAVPELSPTAVAKALAEHFPLLFGAPRALPLKLRIQADIQTRAPGVFTKKSLSIFLHRHTTSTAYLKALVNIPTRHDLDGQPAGEVAEEHRVAATAEVERRRGIVDARRRAERDAQRQAQREAARAARGADTDAGAGAGAGAVTPSAAGAVPGVDGGLASTAAMLDDGAAPALRQPRPPRPDRPNRPDRPPRADRPPQATLPQRGDNSLRPPRPDRQDRPPRPDRPPRADAAPATALADSTQAAREPRQPREPRVPQGPQYSAAELDARRDRAALLRAFETSMLTRANFCVLKRIVEADLEPRLMQARLDRDERGPDTRQQDRRDERPSTRPDGAPPRDGERPTDRPADRGRGGARDFGGPRESRDSRGPRRDAPRAPLPAGERTRPAGSGAAAMPAQKPPHKPGPAKSGR